MSHPESMHNEPVPTQQPEETDQQDAVRAFVSQYPKARAIDISRALGCTEAQALSALSDVTWEIHGADLPQVLTEIRTWERIMILVRNQDAVAEVEVRGDGGYVSGDWLNWIDERYNLHIRIQATHQILALVRSGKRGPTYSFNLVNDEGFVFCRFYTRSQFGSDRFLAFCEKYEPIRSEGLKKDE
jgi:putative heme degradation protein